MLDWPRAEFSRDALLCVHDERDPAGTKDMTTAADFSLLYSELGLAPGAGMDQLKQAYRRRVGRLHPDANGGEGDLARLQHLNQLYAAAVDFHRVHGRLPGAAPSMPQDGTTATPAAVDQTAGSAGATSLPPDHDGPAARDRAGRYAIPLVVAALVATALWLQYRERPAAMPVDPGTGSGSGAHVRGGAMPVKEPARLRLGMDHDSVVAVQGEPHVVDGRRWVYGPSWVEFRCGVVVDWYSSTLTPLHVAGARPAVDVDGVVPPSADHCREN